MMNNAIRRIISLFILSCPVFVWAQPSSSVDSILLQASLFLESNPDSAAILYDRVGVHYRSLASYDSAFKYFMMSFDLREKLNSPRLALSHLYLGSIHQKRWEYESAANEFMKALQVSDDSTYLCYAYNNLGGALTSHAGDYDLAPETSQILLDSAKRMMEEAVRLSNMHQMSNSYYNSLKVNFGHLESTRGNHAEAKKYFKSVSDYYSRDAADTYLNLQHYVTSLNNLGFVEAMLGNLDSALYYYNKGEYLADSMNLLDQYQLFLSNKSHFYDTLRPNQDSMLYYLKKSHAVQLEVRDHLEAEKINELQIQYESEKMRNENAEQRIQIEKAAGERQVLLSIVLFLVLIGLIGYIISKRRDTQREKEFTRINSILKEQEISSFNVVLKAQESERKRIASELHDKLGSTLSAAKLYFNHLEDEKGMFDTVVDYEKGMELLDTAVSDVRTISHAMSTGVLGQFGLAPALIDLKETINGTDRLNMELHMHGLDIERLPRETEMHVYRIIQELISNTLKHSGANKVVVQLTKRDAHLNLLVEDNGQGFEFNADKGGMGLKNLDHRVTILGGSYHLDSRKGRGTTVSVDVPV